MSRRSGRSAPAPRRVGREPGTGVPACRRRGKSELSAWLRPQLIGSRSGQTVTCWSDRDSQPPWAPKVLDADDALEAVRLGVRTPPVLIEAKRDGLGPVVGVYTAAR